MASPARSAYTVRFSTEVARVLECHGHAGRIDFTLDAGSKGDSSICLEHHPPNWPRAVNYDEAFQSARQFLEARGYEVEIHGE
jgi:hypothetical protein